MSLWWWLLGNPKGEQMGKPRDEDVSEQPVKATRPDDGAAWLQTYRATESKSDRLRLLDEREQQLGTGGDSFVDAQRAWIANERNGVQALPD